MEILGLKEEEKIKDLKIFDLKVLKILDLREF